MSNEDSSNQGPTLGYEELQKQLIEREATINYLREIHNNKDEAYYRTQMLQVAQEFNQRLVNLTNQVKESLDLISKKINNLAKIQAKASGIEVQE